MREASIAPGFSFCRISRQARYGAARLPILGNSNFLTSISGLMRFLKRQRLARRLLFRPSQYLKLPSGVGLGVSSRSRSLSSRCCSLRKCRAMFSMGRPCGARAARLFRRCSRCRSRIRRLSAATRFLPLLRRSASSARACRYSRHCSMKTSLTGSGSIFGMSSASGGYTPALYSPSRLQSLDKPKLRSMDEALTAVSPTNTIAPDPFFSKRKPTAASFSCSSFQLPAVLMILWPRSWAIRMADFSPVAFSKSSALAVGLTVCGISRNGICFILRTISPFSLTR